jgi:hypothetical protein
VTAPNTVAAPVVFAKTNDFWEQLSPPLKAKKGDGRIYGRDCGSYRLLARKQSHVRLSPLLFYRHKLTDDGCAGLVAFWISRLLSREPSALQEFRVLHDLD